MRGWFDPSNGDSMGFLAGKRLLITGLLSNRSIAYGIAQACHREGAELAFSYVGERFKDRITEFAKEFNSELIFDCDVGSDEQIAQMFADLAKVWPTFDGFVHSIGFAPREAIAGDFLEGLSLEASVRYTAASLGPKGIRANCISAGPIKTLAASGIKGFSKILSVVEQNAPLRRNVTIEDVGNVAAFMLSDLAE